MPAIVEEEYGNYRIKAGTLSGVYVARAFPKPPARTPGLIAEATGKSEEEAINALKVMIDGRDADRTASRRWEVLAGLAVPMEEEFAEALRQANLTGAQVAMLTNLAHAGVAGLSSANLAKVAGYRSRETAEKTFKRAGALLGAYMGVDLDASDTPSGDGSARIMAFRDRELNDMEAPLWIMHDELRRAVRAVL